MCKRVVVKLVGGWTLRGGELIALLLLAVAFGCSPAPPTMEELGQIVYDPKQVPGADRPYKLPDGLGEHVSPDKAEESPAQADGSPAHADGSPAQADGSPAQADGSPAQADGSPAQPLAPPESEPASHE